jgi:hypothetical protein
VIHRADPDGTLLIGQPAHAWLSGRMARAWAWPFQPWEEICLAAEQHDIGMAAWDARPELDPAAGLPYSFGSMPREMHVGLWREAARLLLPQGRYPALLVSLHGTGLYERYVSEEERRAEPVRSYLEGEHSFQAAMIAALALDAAEVRRNAALVRCWDWLSLFVCTAADGEGSFAGAPAESGEVDLAVRWFEGDPTRIALTPWPFRPGPLALSLEARLLRGSATDQQQLDAAIAAAPLESLSVELRPG